MGARQIDFNYIFFGRHEKKKKIIAVVAIFLLAGLVLYYGYRAEEPSSMKSSEESREEKIGKERPTPPTPQAPMPIQQYRDMCGKFLKKDGEIACITAVERALENFGNSKITKIEKMNLEGKDVYVINFGLEEIKIDAKTVSEQERLAIASGKQQSLALNEFDENYCRQAIFPDNLKTSEYTANYNLEGREGFQSTWSATEKLPGEFSILRMPSYFIVYRNGLLEGCGHKIITEDTGKISFSADFNDENVLCKNKNTIVAKDDAKMPAKIEIFVKTAENTVLYYTIYVNPIFDINKFLNSLGCK